jgi:hypothetical protein
MKNEPTILGSSEAAYAAASEKLAKLRGRLDNAASRLESAREAAAPKSSTVAATALLDDPDGESEPAADLDRLEREHAVLSEAVRIQSERVVNAEGSALKEKYLRHQGEHAEIVRRIVASYEELFDAVSDAKRFENGFRSSAGRIAIPAISYQHYPLLQKILQTSRDGFRRDQERRGFPVDLVKKVR